MLPGNDDNAPILRRNLHPRDRQAGFHRGLDRLDDVRLREGLAGAGHLLQRCPLGILVSLDADYLDFRQVADGLVGIALEPILIG